MSYTFSFTQMNNTEFNELMNSVIDSDCFTQEICTIPREIENEGHHRFTYEFLDDDNVLITWMD